MDKQAELRKLRDKLVNARKDSEAILDEAQGAEGGLSGDLLARFESSDSVVDESVRAIDAINRSIESDRLDTEVVEEREERTGTPQEQYNEVFHKYLRSGVQGMDQADRMILSESRAQSVGTTTEGGFTVPEGFWNRVSEVKLAYGGVEGVANVITTATGNNLPWMTNDDTANTGAILGENTVLPETADLVFGQRTLGAFKYTSDLIRVSYELLQDTAIDIEGFIARKLGERLGRIHNTHYTNGTGTGQPDGLIPGLTSARTSETAGGIIITHDDLIEVVYAVDPAYMAAGSARFMFNHATAGELRKTTDGDGNKAWAPGLVAGEPGSVLGFPFTINQDMDDVGINNVPLAFGDFREAYVVRNVKGMELVRLDERYADLLQVGFFAWDRSDGQQDNIGAVRTLTMAAA